MSTSLRLTLDKPVQLPSLAQLFAPVRASADRLLHTGVNHLNTVVPVDRGLTRNSLQAGVAMTKVEPGGPDGLPGAVTWGTKAPGGISNAGKRRGPGKASPVAEIERWIRRKGLAPKPLPPTKSGRPRKRQNQAAAIRSFAFAISQSHKQRGQATGPAYVAGPHASASTAGWFDTLGPVMESALDAELGRLGAAIVGGWSSGV
jgi:hypothetical protein